MPFEQNVFISYAHMDNRPLSEKEQGWITLFHSTLSNVLSTRMGREAKIWRDKKLSGNDIFADEIVSQFPKTELLVSVLTPRYVNSEWCRREVEEFCKSAEKSGGLIVDNKSRVLKVIKTPVDSEESLPAVMKEALGYPFYIFDERQVPVELDPAFGGDEYSQKFNRKMVELAFDIAALIKKLESGAAPAKSPTQAAGSTKPVVYLAECSYDRREDREALQAELKTHGYVLLPELKLPLDEADYLAEVDKLLSQSTLSVHLVGTKYGMVPDGPSDKSVVVLQNDVALQHARKGPLQRIIWVPAGARCDSPQQQQFIDALLSDANLQAGADLITGDLETLKGAMHAALKRLEAAAAAKTKPAQDTAEAGSRLMYLICDERDRKAVLPLRKFLKSQGVEAKIPLFEGDAAAIRQAHQDMLTQCDAVLLFYGAGDEAWKRAVESDLKKVPGYRGAKPMLATYTYLAEPVTTDKGELIELEEPNLVNALEGFSEASFEPFLKKLAGAKP